MSAAGRIRLAFLVPHTGMSGAEVNIGYLLQALPKTEFDVHVIGPASQPLLKQARDLGWTAFAGAFPKFASTSLEIAGVRIFNSFATIYDLFVVLRISLWLANYVHHNRIQILYTGAVMTHLIGILTRLIRPEMLVVVHMQTIISPHLVGGLGRVFFNAIARYAARVIAVSKAVADPLPPTDRVVLVYNGADVAAYEPVRESTLRQEIGLSSTDILIGVIGRLTPWKGHRLFLDAAAKLVEAGIDGHFVIVGDDVDPVTGESQYRPVLEEYASRLGIKGRVTFAGFRKDIPNVMHGLDILVVPSLRPDPSPLVAVEGMASGLPIVGSNSGGVAEVILDGKTGRLFPPGDCAALTAILQDLIEHPVLRTQYGAAARQRARDCFSLTRFTNALTDIFREVSAEQMRIGGEK